MSLSQRDLCHYLVQFISTATVPASTFNVILYPVAAATFEIIKTESGTETTVIVHISYPHIILHVEPLRKVTRIDSVDTRVLDRLPLYYFQLNSQPAHGRDLRADPVRSFTKHALDLNSQGTL